MNSKKKIIIIEDIPLFNNMMKNTLSSEFDIVKTSTSAKDMLSLCDIYHPDLVLTDVMTENNANGIKYAKDVKDKYGNEIKVLAITGIPEISFLDLAKKNNLDGLIYKDTSVESLITSINQILNGYTLFPDNYVYNEDNEKLRNLTAKELKILKLLCNGNEREDIANILNITLGTLKNYISNILNKMEFESVSTLTMFCIRNGYIVPDIEEK